MIADSHCHVDLPQFDADRDAVLARAREAGVELVIQIATASPAESSVERTLELATRCDFVYAGLGVHPHDARLADAPYLESLLRASEHPKVVVWGEIGLDYHYDHSPRETQRAVFARQLDMARERGLPVSIHCREAWADLLAIASQAAHAGGLRGIVHSFTGGRDEARACADLGLAISFSGIVTFKNAAPLREALAALPLDGILVETDAPYLAPVPHRGVRNEPAFVVDVARGVAATLGVSFEEVAAATLRNLCGLLRIPDDATPRRL